jgi:hypothetical protein
MLGKQVPGLFRQQFLLFRKIEIHGVLTLYFLERTISTYITRSITIRPEKGRLT